MRVPASQCPKEHALCEIFIRNYLHLEQNFILRINTTLFCSALINTEFSGIITRQGTNSALLKRCVAIAHYNEIKSLHQSSPYDLCSNCQGVSNPPPHRSRGLKAPRSLRNGRETRASASACPLMPLPWPTPARLRPGQLAEGRGRPRTGPRSPSLRLANTPAL